VTLFNLHHDVLLHHRPKTMDSSEQRLKSRNLEAKQAFPPFKLFISGIYHNNAKLVDMQPGGGNTEEIHTLKRSLKAGHGGTLL
jgi:hypothetical protein